LIFFRGRQSFFFWALAIFLYGMAWLLQAELFLSWDVSWLMLAAERLLKGGTYTNDFFETNPPLILWLYLPPVVFSQWLVLDAALLLRLYIFLLATLSLGLCINLSAKIFSEKEAFLAQIFIIAILSCFLLLPIYEFGQRDHLLVILTLPYFLLLTLRLKEKPFPIYYVVLVGLLAAIGFSIKPHFLAALILVEGYFMWRKSSFRALVRVETGLIASFVLFYLAAIFYFFPDYLFFMVPFSLRLYYFAQSDSWAMILAQPAVFFCGFTFLFYLAMERGKPFDDLSAVLLIALMGFLFSYFSQRANLYYHLLPAFSLALLLQVFLLSLFILQKSLEPRFYYRLSLPALLLLACIFFAFNSIWTLLILSPAVFFCSFGIIFAVLLTKAQSDKKPVVVLVSIFCLVFFSYLGFYLAARTSFYPHAFFITLFLMFSIFTLFSGRVDKRLYPGPGLSPSSAQLFMAILATLIFALPVYFLNGKYIVAENYKKYLAINLSTLSKQRLPRSVYFFHTTMAGTFMSIEATKIRLASRFPFLWPVAGLVNRQLAEGGKLPLQKDKALLLDMIASDFNKNKPDLVLMDVSPVKPHIKNPEFDYLSYFLSHPGFRAVWKNYRYETTIHEPGFYKIAVYERIK
jgi:hypothetical protein